MSKRNLFGALFVFVLGFRQVVFFCSTLHFHASQFFDDIIYDIETLVRPKLKVNLAKVIKVQVFWHLLFALPLKRCKYSACLFASRFLELNYVVRHI